MTCMWYIQYIIQYSSVMLFAYNHLICFLFFVVILLIYWNKKPQKVKTTIFMVDLTVNYMREENKHEIKKICERTTCCTCNFSLSRMSMKREQMYRNNYRKEWKRRINTISCIEYSKKVKNGMAYKNLFDQSLISILLILLFFLLQKLSLFKCSFFIFIE